MVTVDAPLFGVVMILHGRVLERGSHEAERVGASMGFPPREQIVAEACRFWIQSDDGLRECRTREQISKITAAAIAEPSDLLDTGKGGIRVISYR